MTGRRKGWSYACADVKTFTCFCKLHKYAPPFGDPTYLGLQQGTLLSTSTRINSQPNFAQGFLDKMFRNGCEEVFAAHVS